jgi:hypothetical protein
MVSLTAVAVVATALTAEPRFALTSPDQDRLVGTIVRLNPDGTATVATEGGEVRITDLVSVYRTDKPVLPPPTGPHLITTAGERIAGTLIGGDAQTLRFRPTGILLKPTEAWTVPFSAVAVLWLTTTPAETPLDPARYDWLGENRNRDVLRLRNGDVVRGTLEGIESEAETVTLRLRPEQGQVRSLGSDELTAIAFNPSLARSRKPKGLFVRVVLTDGSRLAVVNPSVNRGLLTGETLYGDAVVLSLDSLLSLHVMQGKAVYLSDLKPRKAEQSGFFGVTWPWAADRSVRGHSLRLCTPVGESTYEKGLGTHPRTVLNYTLNGKYRLFEALVGLAPDAAGGQAVVRVRVDGQLQPVPGLAKMSRTQVVPIRIDLRGAKELTLEIDFGPTGGVLADVNWIDARLVE